MTNDILFASLDLPPFDKEKMLADIRAVPENLWHWEPYRGTRALTLMTHNGNVSLNDAITFTKTNGYYWTPCAPASIVDYFEKYIFNWLQPKPRIMVLRTAPHTANNEHIDCIPETFNTRQHKFRIVLSGRVDSLYFITKKGNVFVPETDRPFIMDGGWPHGMNNTSDQEKITICVGAPWTGADKYPKFLQTLYRADHQMPENYDVYFERTKPSNDLEK